MADVKPYVMMDNIVSKYVAIVFLPQFLADYFKLLWHILAQICNGRCCCHMLWLML